MGYASQRATALRLLIKFGKSVSLVRESSGGTYDPGTGVTSGAVSLTLTGSGVLLNFNNSEINNDTILSTDRRLLYQGDALQIGDMYGNWRVYSVMELDPDESGTILTTAQMRK